MRIMPSKELVKEIKIGWNLGDTLDATGGKGIASETSWGNPLTTEAMFQVIKNSGFKTARIPVTWEKHMGKEPDCAISEEWMDRVREIVDFAYNKDMFVILNMHHEKWHMPTYANLENAKRILAKAWSQIAERFKDYGERLIFESMNEPRMIGTEFEWNGGNEEGWDVLNQLNEIFVETVRKSGGNNKNRHLLLPTYAASSEESALKAFRMPANADDKVMVSVHAYTPYEFALSDKKLNTWSRKNVNDTAPIDHLMEKLNRIFVSKGYPVILGEFGSRDKGNLEARVDWSEYYVAKASEIGVPCIWWDNGSFEGSGERFGLLDRNELNWRYPEIVEALMKGLE